MRSHPRGARDLVGDRQAGARHRPDRAPSSRPAPIVPIREYGADVNRRHRPNPGVSNPGGHRGRTRRSPRGMLPAGRRRHPCRRTRIPRCAAFGSALSVVALILLLTGFGRITARMEISGSIVAWTWAFSRFTVALSDLEDAELVEKGSPASGGSWAGFLGGGVVAAAAWWVVGLAAAFLRSGPSLGPLDLVVIKRHGGAVEVQPISAWSTRSSRSQADEALHAVRAAIAASARRRPPEPPPLSMIRHDAWDPAPATGEAPPEG